MSHFWSRLAAAPIDAIGAGALLLIVLGGALLIGLAWHHFSAWVPRTRPRMRLRRPRLRWPKLRRRRSPAGDSAPRPVEASPVHTLPDLPAETFLSRADALAAQGRYADAVRERLHAIVRELVDAGLIRAHPEWTVTELAAAAATARPALRPPLDGAGLTFSDIWYGQRAASATHDDAMRGYADDVHTILRTAGATR